MSAIGTACRRVAPGLRWVDYGTLALAEPEGGPFSLVLVGTKIPPRCPTCRGRGEVVDPPRHADPLDGTVRCEDCHGSGVLGYVPPDVPAHDMSDADDVGF